MTDQQLLDAQQRLQKLHGIEAPAPAPDAAELAAGLVNLVAAKTEAGAERDTEYMGEDGLLHCKICGGKRQTIITLPFENAQPRTVRCWCNCPTDLDRSREKEKQIKMEQRRSVCFRGTEELKDCRFDTDDGTQKPELITAAKNTPTTSRST